MAEVVLVEEDVVVGTTAAAPLGPMTPEKRAPPPVAAPATAIPGTTSYRRWPAESCLFLYECQLLWQRICNILTSRSRMFVTCTTKWIVRCLSHCCLASILAVAPAAAGGGLSRDSGAIAAADQAILDVNTFLGSAAAGTAAPAADAAPEAPATVPPAVEAAGDGSTRWRGIDMS